MANDGTFSNSTRVTLPSRHCAVTSIRPAGTSSCSVVTGSTIGIIPVSSSTVVTTIRFVPDIVAKSADCSMITKPASARGSVGGRSTFTHERG